MWTAAVFFAIAAAIGYVALDSAIAAATVGRAHDTGFWTQILLLTDRIAIGEHGTLLVPAILMLAAGLLFVTRSTRPLGYGLFYVGLVQLLSGGIAELAAGWLGRVPPFEVVRGGDLWFGGGHAFPATRVAFVGGLFFPLALLTPRLAPLWAIPPLLVGIAAVLQHVHYLSDSAVALALAAALAAGFAPLAERARG